MSTRAALIATIALVACVAAGCAAPPPPRDARAADSADPVDALTAEQLFETGEALARAGEQVRAEQYIAAAVVRGYPEREALPLLLRTCIASSRFGAALSYVRPYLRKQPDDTVLRYLLGSVLIGLDRHSEAHRELSRVARERPDFAPVRYLLGLLDHEVFEDADAARASFQAYLDLDPRGVHALEVRAWLREHPAQLSAGDAAVAPDPAAIPEALP